MKIYRLIAIALLVLASLMPLVLSGAVSMASADFVAYTYQFTSTLTYHYQSPNSYNYQVIDWGASAPFSGYDEPYYTGSTKEYTNYNLNGWQICATFLGSTGATTNVRVYKNSGGTLLATLTNGACYTFTSTTTALNVDRGGGNCVGNGICGGSSFAYTIDLNAPATATATPTATYTPVDLSGGLGSFNAWCPTDAADFGNDYSHTWLVACGCIVGVDSPFIATSTGTLPASSTPTATLNGGTKTAMAQTGTATNTATRTNTATATLTETPRPTVTATDYLHGSSSYDAFYTATAHSVYLTAAANYTPTHSPNYGTMEISDYCSEPLVRSRLVDVRLLNYVDTVCLPDLPEMEYIAEGISMFGFTLPDVELYFPGSHICLERYGFPRIAFLGVEIYLEMIIVFGLGMAWVFKGLGRV